MNKFTKHWPHDGREDYEYKEPLEDDPNAEPFHIGQSYENAPAVVQKCIQCGGNHFQLAIGDYYTAIRCVVCKWEHCIHEG